MITSDDLRMALGGLQEVDPTFTMARFARETGFSESAMSRWVNDKHIPNRGNELIIKTYLKSKGIII